MNDSLNQILNQAKKIQEKIGSKHKNLTNQLFVGESGAGMVKITINGLHQAKACEIDDSLMKEDKRVLQDLIVAAMSDAEEKCHEQTQENMTQLTADFDIEEFINLTSSDSKS